MMIQNFDNKMFELVNDFASIQRSLIPSTNLATTDHLTRRLQELEALVKKATGGSGDLKK